VEGMRGLAHTLAREDLMMRSLLIVATIVVTKRHRVPFRTATRWTALAITALMSLPIQLPAQEIRGLVVDSARGTTVGRGFVVLLDPVGNEVARSLSSQAGEYSLRAPYAGQYWLRSERIGFRAFLSEAFDLSDGQTLEYTLRVAALPVRLATLVVPGRDRCNANPEQGANTVLIWEEIRKALAASVWGDEQELVHYRQYTYRRVLNERRSRNLNETGVTKSGFADPPFRSVPAEQLASEGYIAERSDGVWYYLPDAHTLLDEQFLNSHCFHVVRDEGDRPGQVGLAFEPMNDRKLPDVEGAMWLDEASSELRELHVRHTRLQYDVRDVRIGGTVRFMMLPSGAWIVREWQVRTPKLTVTQHPRYPRGHRAEVEGFTDTGGEIYEVSTRNGTLIYKAPLATVVGNVYDSTSAAFLGGAFVSVTGTDFRARTDSAGRFELSVPIEGEYSLTLAHPRLDSVAAPGMVEPVELVRDTVTEVAFAVPHVRTAMRRLCGRTVRPQNSRMVFGIVRDAEAGRPMTGAKVSASWQAMDLSNRGGGRRNPRGGVSPDASGLVAVVRDIRQEVDTDETGFYSICGIPADRPIWLSAESDGRRSREAGMIFPRQPGDALLMAWDKPPGQPYDDRYLAPGPAWKVDLTVGDPRRVAVERETPILYGTVTDSATGDPVDGVTVILNGSQRTTTAPDGGYELPTGISRETVNHIEFLRLGFTPGTIELQINTSDREVQLNVALTRLAVRMAEVVVEGERISVPQRLVGFYERRKVGIGQFLTEEDWEELPTSVVRDVLNRIPGLRVADWRVLLSNATFTCRRQGTSARIWVDGVSVNPGFIQDVNVDNVAAIEVYHRIADIPVQYNSSADQPAGTRNESGTSSACGVVLIWTNWESCSVPFWRLDVTHRIKYCTAQLKHIYRQSSGRHSGGRIG
jgi:carboxypeptidase-like protein